jgi:hypothetical protein
MVLRAPREGERDVPCSRSSARRTRRDPTIRISQGHSVVDDHSALVLRQLGVLTRRHGLNADHIPSCHCAVQAWPLDTSKLALTHSFNSRLWVFRYRRT